MAEKKTDQKTGAAKKEPFALGGEGTNSFERRQWMKGGLGALGALGLGGVALSACRQAVEGPPKEPLGKPWREDKIFVFKETDAQGAVEWFVSPGHKVVSPGQVVKWRAFGFEKQAEIKFRQEANPFEVETVTIARPGGVEVAKVRADAAPGFYPYKVVIDEKHEAKGGSYPGMIVD